MPKLKRKHRTPLFVYMSQDTKDRFKKYCANLDYKMGQRVRFLIEKELADADKKSR